MTLLCENQSLLYSCSSSGITTLSDAFIVQNEARNLLVIYALILVHTAAKVDAGSGEID